LVQRCNEPIDQTHPSARANPMVDSDTIPKEAWDADDGMRRKTGISCPIPKTGIKWPNGQVMVVLTKGVPRNYMGEDGRLVAATDALKESKTRLSKSLASKISNLADPERRFPSNIAKLFAIISKVHDMKKSESA